MEEIYAVLRHKKISHSTKEVTEKMACLIGVEPTAFRLGVLSSLQNSVKNGTFLVILGVLCAIFALELSILMVVLKGFSSFKATSIPK